ncbi:GntR family transcriptional regulator [Klebsiella pneumoniae]|nr:GntR family transcriptional regulator [Klebsiella pneumoniae]
MNIPDEGFFTLLTQGMRNRTVETLQRALTTPYVTLSCREP